MTSALRYRLLALVGLFLAVLYADHRGVFYYLDHAIAEKRMAFKHRPASDTIVLLEIDNKSLSSIGSWPWPRAIYGDIIQTSFDQGAEEVVFDVDFSANSSADQDQAFGAALANAPGPVTLAIFQQNDVSDPNKASLSTNRPIEPLADNAWLATVNMLADKDGRVRHFPYAQEIDGALLPSLSSVLGGQQRLTPDSFIIDYGIDLETIPTYSVIEVLNGTLPEGALDGRKILIGAGAAELRDTIAVPVHGMMSGPELQVVAAENLIAGRALNYIPEFWHILSLVCILITVLVIAIFRGGNGIRKLLLLGALSVGVETIAFLIYINWPILVPTGCMQTLIASSATTILLFEFRLKELLLTLSNKHSESISALLKTIVTDSFSGILVVDQAGHILEISHQGQTILAQFGKHPQIGDKAASVVPEALAAPLIASLKAPDAFGSEQSMKTLAIPHGDDTRFIEYSLTPSHVTTRTNGKHHEQWVATLLFHDTTEARKAQMQREYLADHDPLTGLLNRSGFINGVEQLRQEKAARYELVFACRGARVEKVIHSLGADYADLMLKQAGERLTALGCFDLIGCTERRKFLLHWQGDAPASIDGLIRQIGSCFDEPFVLRGHNAKIGHSVGVADGSENRQTAEDLVKEATVALHRAREIGEQTLIYNSALAADILQQRELERESIKALERDEFRLCYQPQVCLKTGKTIGCEALIRWHHEELGLIRPDIFIPIIEENGMIVELGRWILKTACRDAMAWPEPVTVAVNASAVQFVHSDLREDIRAALAESGLPAERLQIEITESLFISDPEQVVRRLNAIREDGIKIALDDFGTGYSSLSYIHQFPLDKIKIDRAFVKDLPYSHDSLAVINAVVALARGFDMQIVAEGMENKKQADVLRAAGCHVGQGYFFGKPLEQEAFIAHLSHEAAEIPRARANGTTN